MTSQPNPLRRLLLAFAVSTVVAAGCSSGAAPAAPAASQPPSASLPPAGDPSIDPGAGSGGGGSVGGNPGSSVGGGAIVDPTPVDPAAGEPSIVIPKPGQKNPHPVAPSRLQASVDGRHVLVKVSWWSGVEPCNVLDSVRVDRSGTDIAITIIEGSSDLDAMCIEIAQLKATIVDLGDLEPGTYMITAPNSEATPIQVTTT